MDTYILRIYRGTPERQYWQEFELSFENATTVIAALMHIRKHPVTKQGECVTPVVWEDGCLEEVCGSCSMLINGVPRQACSALIAKLLEKRSDNTIYLAPFTKYPLVRDLIVDRSSMFENLKKVKGWIEAGDSKQTDKPPLISEVQQELMYQLSCCMSCGCCVEACPQVNKKSSFIGPAAISQARLYNTHPKGHGQRAERLRPLMQEGGVLDCGDAQNCVRVCPKRIALTDSIAAISRDVTLQSLQDLLSFPERQS